MTDKKINVTVIHSDVPVPVNHDSYPWLELKVGQSFEFPLEKRNSIQSRASHMNKKTNRTFVVRKINDTTGGVWRMKDKE